ncbi:MAG: transcriptional repressor [Bacteroidales bacterium]|nr:transcriptional repressor [Bacteroidales bacterium]MCF8456288.1 transcriptional repressor [Bacteroidales bacterium]
MELNIDSTKNKLSTSGLKVTPQRMAILEAIYKLENHPTAENIIEYIRETHPNIATGTVYKVLDTLVEKNLIKRVKTDRDIMRYDGMMESHHHLYCSECDLIEDYVDEELDLILKNYFRDKKLPGFYLEDIVVQVRGTFDKC